MTFTALSGPSKNGRFPGAARRLYLAGEVRIGVRGRWSLANDVEMRRVGIGRDCRGEAMMSRQDAVGDGDDRNESRVGPGEGFGVA